MNRIDFFDWVAIGREMGGGVRPGGLMVDG